MPAISPARGNPNFVWQGHAVAISYKAPCTAINERNEQPVDFTDMIPHRRRRYTQALDTELMEIRKTAPPDTEASNLKPESNLSRRLVVCIDGTSNQFSEKNTNVIELYNRIEKNNTQLTYYNSGIGTFAKPSWRSYSYLKQWLYNKIDLAIAWNLEKVIIGAYRWLSDTYRDGDQIFLFGFSRGAYQVRALAAMINSVGLLYAGNQEQIPFAWELYASHTQSTMTEIFKETFCYKKVDIRFLGAWDTVSSIGFFRGKLLPLIQECNHITYFRHALALDERRVKFLPEFVKPSQQQTENKHVKEVWFAGTHSDIGGGNKTNLSLTRRAQPLMWMIDEAEEAGLKFERRNRDIKVHTDYAEVTESLKGGWWLFEILPITRESYRLAARTRGVTSQNTTEGEEETSEDPGDSRVTNRMHWGRGRKVFPHHKVHWTVLASYKQIINRSEYEPRASLRKHDGTRIQPQDPGWVDFFKSTAASETAEDTEWPGWEGETNLVETLWLIKSLDAGDRGLEALLAHTAHPSKSNMVWTYGGVSFLQKLAERDQEGGVKPSTIIKQIVGLRSNDESRPQTKAPKDTNQVPSDLEVPNQNGVDIDPESQYITLTTLPRVTGLLQLCKPLIPTTETPEDQKPPPPRFPGLSFPGLSLSRPSWWPAAEPTADAIPETNEAKVQDVAQGSAPSMKLVAVVTEVVTELVEKHVKNTYTDSDILEDFLQLTSTTLPEQSKEMQLARDMINLVTKIADSSIGVWILKRINTEQVALRLTPLLQLQGNHLPLVLSAIRAVKVLAAAASEMRDALVKQAVAPKLIDLLRSGKDAVRKETLGALAILTEHDQDSTDLIVVGAVETLYPLMNSNPDAIKTLANLAIHNDIRASLIELKCVELIVAILKTKDAGTAKLQAVLGLVRALADHDDSRSELARNEVPPALVQLIVSGTLIPETLDTLSRLNPPGELINQIPVERLIPAIRQKDNKAILAIGKLSKSFAATAYRTIIEQFDPWIIESINSNDVEAATAAIKVLTDLAEREWEREPEPKQTMSERAVQELARLLRTALERDSYYNYGEFREDRINITMEAFNMVEKISHYAGARACLISEGAYKTVVSLTDGPVSWDLDRAASRLLEQLEIYDDIKDEVLKHQTPPSEDTESNHEVQTGSELLNKETTSLRSSRDNIVQPEGGAQ